MFATQPLQKNAIATAPDHLEQQLQAARQELAQRKQQQQNRQH